MEGSPGKVAGKHPAARPPLSRAGWQTAWPTVASAYSVHQAGPATIANRSGPRAWNPPRLLPCEEPVSRRRVAAVTRIRRDAVKAGPGLGWRPADASRKGCLTEMPRCPGRARPGSERGSLSGDVVRLPRLRRMLGIPWRTPRRRRPYSLRPDGPRRRRRLARLRRGPFSMVAEPEGKPGDSQAPARTGGLKGKAPAGEGYTSLADCGSRDSPDGGKQR
jgi:hypothetical protein